MNAEASNGTTVSFGAVIQRYLAEEIPERPSTASRYQCWLKNHVEPKWRDYPIEQIKPLLVEDWLKKLNLAPKSKSHLKNLMRVLFNAGMRWGLIPYQHNPMSLVRVKDSSKRLREPKALSVDEFRKVLENIPEPFQTMCIVAMPDRLAHVPPQPFNVASRARCRSQGAAGTLAACRCSNHHEHLHPGCS